jgi:hypothetical protein
MISGLFLRVKMASVIKSVVSIVLKNLKISDKLYNKGIDIECFLTYLDSFLNVGCFNHKNSVISYFNHIEISCLLLSIIR